MGKIELWQLEYLMGRLGIMEPPYATNYTYMSFTETKAYLRRMCVSWQG